MSDKKKKIPDNLEGMVTDDLKKLVFEGLLGNLNNPYEGLGELDPPEVKAEREKNKPRLYIILKHNYQHAGSWLMYAADDESIYRYIFYKFFENFIACSDFFENIRIKQTPAEIARESDPSTFNFFDIKEMIDKSHYIYGHDNIFAFRITELTMTTLTTVRKLREKMPDPCDLIPPRDYDDDYLGYLQQSTKNKPKQTIVANNQTEPDDTTPVKKGKTVKSDQDKVESIKPDQGKAETVKSTSVKKGKTVKPDQDKVESVKTTPVKKGKSVKPDQDKAETVKTTPVKKGKTVKPDQDKAETVKTTPVKKGKTVKP